MDLRAGSGLDLAGFLSTLTAALTAGWSGPSIFFLFFFFFINEIQMSETSTLCKAAQPLFPALASALCYLCGFLFYSFLSLL